MVPAVVRLARAADGRACRSGADHGGELVDCVLDHFVSTSLVSALPVTSSSNSAETFP